MSHVMGTQKLWPEPLALAFQDLRQGQSHVQAMILAQPNWAQHGLAHGFELGWGEARWSPGVNNHSIDHSM